VLETLVNYNYPSCEGVGLTPKSTERFQSEFFKRDSKKVSNIFIQIVSDILKQGWSCAWSYSDSGAVNIPETIQSIEERNNCTVKSYSIPYIHNSQGGHRPKKVTEFLIIFTPKK
jgi:hypothetical protein